MEDIHEKTYDRPATGEHIREKRNLLGFMQDEMAGKTEENGYPGETAEVSAILTMLNNSVLIKSEQFLADLISLYRNLTSASSGQIHGTAHNAVTHP